MSKEKNEIEIEKIIITMFYKDEDGQTNIAKRTALTIESAIENCGKLESYLDQLKADTPLHE